jgi:hypothetical protein
MLIAIEVPTAPHSEYRPPDTGFRVYFLFFISL